MSELRSTTPQEERSAHCWCKLFVLNEIARKIILGIGEWLSYWIIKGNNLSWMYFICLPSLAFQSLLGKFVSLSRSHCLCHSDEGSEAEERDAFCRPAPSVAHGVGDVCCWKRREGQEKQCGLANTRFACQIDTTLGCSVRVDSYVYYLSFSKTRYGNIDRKCGSCCKRWRVKWCTSWTSSFISLWFCSKKLFRFPRGFGRCLWFQSESRSKRVQMSYLRHPCSCGAHRQELQQSC